MRGWEVWSAQGVRPLTLPGHKAPSHVHALTFAQLQAGPPAHSCTSVSYNSLRAHIHAYTHSHRAQSHVQLHMDPCTQMLT